MKPHKLKKGGYIAILSNFEALSTDDELIIYNNGEEVYRCIYQGDTFLYTNQEYNIKRVVKYPELFTIGFIRNRFKEKENFCMIGRKFSYSSVQWALYNKLMPRVEGFFNDKIEDEPLKLLFKEKLENIKLPHHILGDRIFDIVEDNNEYKTKLAKILSYLEYNGFKTISDVFTEEFGQISKDGIRLTLSEGVEMVKFYLQEKLYVKKINKK